MSSDADGEMAARGCGDAAKRVDEFKTSLATESEALSAVSEAAAAGWVAACGCGLQVSQRAGRTFVARLRSRKLVTYLW